MWVGSFYATGNITTSDRKFCGKKTQDSGLKSWNKFFLQLYSWYKSSVNEKQVYYKPKLHLVKISSYYILICIKYFIVNSIYLPYNNIIIHTESSLVTVFYSVLVSNVIVCAKWNLNYDHLNKLITFWSRILYIAC